MGNKYSQIPRGIVPQELQDGQNVLEEDLHGFKVLDRCMDYEAEAKSYQRNEPYAYSRCIARVILPAKSVVFKTHDRLKSDTVFIENLCNLDQIDFDAPGSCSFMEGSMFKDGRWQALCLQEEYHIRCSFSPTREEALAAFEA